MSPGEVFLGQFPFGDVAGMKLRPALLLTGKVGSVPEVLVAYISSVKPSHILASDLELDPSKPEFKSTNLKVISTLRLHKLATIHASSLVSRLGFLDTATYAVVHARLKVLLSLQ